MQKKNITHPVTISSVINGELSAIKIVIKVMVRHNLLASLLSLSFFSVSFSSTSILTSKSGLLYFFSLGSFIAEYIYI